MNLESRSHLNPEDLLKERPAGVGRSIGPEPIQPRENNQLHGVEAPNGLNKASFGGARIGACYSCHHGDVRLESVPSLLAQYSLPVEDPNKVEIVPDAPPDPSADQILDKYIKALGDPQRLTSFVAKGTYEGYDTYEQKVPLEILPRRPISVR